MLESATGTTAEILSGTPAEALSEPARATTGQFLPGRSGNPGGRPKGSRNKVRLLADWIGEAETEALIEMVVDKALAGDAAAMRACFARLVPQPKKVRVVLELPEVTCAEDAAKAGAIVFRAMAAGEIGVEEAEKVLRVLAAQLKLVEAAAAAKPGTGRTDGVSAPLSSRPAAAGRDAPQPCISPVKAAGPVASPRVPAAAMACPAPGRGAPASPAFVARSEVGAGSGDRPANSLRRLAQAGRGPLPIPPANGAPTGRPASRAA